jgi:hypothetical protein
MNRSRYHRSHWAVSLVSTRELFEEQDQRSQRANLRFVVQRICPEKPNGRKEKLEDHESDSLKGEPKKTKEKAIHHEAGEGDVLNSRGANDEADGGKKGRKGDGD